MNKQQRHTLLTDCGWVLFSFLIFGFSLLATYLPGLVAVNGEMQKELTASLLSDPGYVTFRQGVIQLQYPSTWKLPYTNTQQDSKHIVFDTDMEEDNGYLALVSKKDASIENIKTTDELKDSMVNDFEVLKTILDQGFNFTLPEKTTFSGLPAYKITEEFDTDEVKIKLDTTFLLQDGVIYVLNISNQVDAKIAQEIKNSFSLVKDEDKRVYEKPRPSITLEKSTSNKVPAVKKSVASGVPRVGRTSQGYWENAGKSTAKVQKYTSKFDTEGDVVLGKGPVEVVEFFDFRCPGCKTFYEEGRPLLSKLVKEGKITHILKDFPLVYHPRSEEFHSAANCALKLGGVKAYDQMTAWLFTLQETWKDDEIPEGVEENINAFADELGLEKYKFFACMEDESIAAEIKKDQEEGVKNNIQSVAAVFVQGRKITNPWDYKSIINEVEKVFVSLKKKAVGVLRKSTNWKNTGLGEKRARETVASDQSQKEQTLKDSAYKKMVVSKKAVEAYKAGLEYLDQKRFTLALTEFTKATELRPHEAWYFLGKGRALMGLNQKDEAITTFKKVLELDVRNSEARKYLKTLVPQEVKK